MAFTELPLSANGKFQAVKKAGSIYFQLFSARICCDTGGELYNRAVRRWLLRCQVPIIYLWGVPDYKLCGLPQGQQALNQD